MKHLSLAEKIGYFGLLLIVFSNAVLYLIGHFSVYLFVFFLPFLVIARAGYEFRNKRK